MRFIFLSTLVLVVVSIPGAPVPLDRFPHSIVPVYRNLPVYRSPAGDVPTNHLASPPFPEPFHSDPLRFHLGIQDFFCQDGLLQFIFGFCYIFCFTQLLVSGIQWFSEVALCSLSKPISLPDLFRSWFESIGEDPLWEAQAILIQVLLQGQTQSIFFPTKELPPNIDGNAAHQRL